LANSLRTSGRRGLPTKEIKSNIKNMFWKRLIKIVESYNNTYDGGLELSYRSLVFLLKSFSDWSKNTFHKSWKEYIFFWYIISIFGFAWVYYSRFQIKNDSFIFNSEIINNEQKKLKKTDSLYLNQLLYRKAILEQFYQHFDVNTPQILYRKTILGQVFFLHTFKDNIDGGEYKISFQDHIYKHTNDNGSITILTPFFIDKGVIQTNNQNVSLISYYIPKYITTIPKYDTPFKINWKKIPSSIFEAKKIVLKNGIDNLEIWIKEIQTKSYPISDCIDYWDFVYFSTITQNTIGYGDISPGDKITRHLVTFQSIISIFLVTVLINLKIQRKNDENKIGNVLNTDSENTP
jgi:hypothetical protein